MRLTKSLLRTLLFLSAIGLAVAVDAITERADAQVYQCPPGYFWDPSYGCLPVGYFYGPPYYPYPDIGFGFFYGVGPGYRYGRGFAPRGIAPHGGRR